MYIQMHIKTNICIYLFFCLFYHVEMENTIENLLNAKKFKDMTVLRNSVSNLSVYQTEDKKFFFVKEDCRSKSERMFNGELEGLKAIRSTKTVLAPNPIATGRLNSSYHYIVLEYLNMTKLSSNCSAEFGSLLADMHMHNWLDKQHSIKKFGFHVETSCGSVPQNNTWTDDWLTFFTENRLDYQVQLLLPSSKIYKEEKRIMGIYWPKLRELIPKFFEGVKIKPSLLHGNLWSGNVAQTNSKPVIFDPATFYGHNEYDLASTTLFDEFPKEFFDAYFKKIPKTNGFDNRMKLYHLFHYLNHWNHFGAIYEQPTLRLFHSLFAIFD